MPILMIKEFLTRIFLMGSVKRIIKKCPSIIKKAYYRAVPFEKRYGEVFQETYRNLMITKDWDRDKLLDYQNSQFIDLIHHAYRNVPYYRRVMKERGLSPKSFQSVEDITLLPVLTKDIIRENFNDLIAVNMKHMKHVEFRTSGSTGKKLIFRGTDDVFKREAAFVLRSWKLCGATMYDKPSVWLRRFVPKDGGNLWYYDYELRRLYMSAYNLNINTIKDYVNKINEQKYHTLVTYPSSAYILACLCEEAGLELKHIKAIRVASEKMLDEWRDKVYEVFGIMPKMHYGLMEKVAFHHQPKDSHHYYENLEYGVTEFVKEGNHNVIVGTGFINKYMPFIRYKTNDVGILNPDKNSMFRMLEVDGRCDDILISSNGSRLPGVNFYTMMYKIDGVKMFKIIQKSLQEIEFLLVPNEKYNENTIDEINNGLRDRLGNLDINIKVVDEIERSTTTGKVRCIFNECDL